MTKKISPGTLLANVRWAKEVPDKEFYKRISQLAAKARRRNKLAREQGKKI